MAPSPIRRASWLLLGATVIVPLGASCAGSHDVRAASIDSVEVRPFAEVQASDFVFEPDPTDPRRGIFRVETTEPMICAIVWGEDETFGRLNNSLSMNGTGIVDHDVVLPDVESGVVYRYVVQGTTADGTLYRSPVGSFRLDPVPSTATVVDRGDNLALAATVVEVSSEFSADFAGELAIDGDTATEWATSGDGDDGFITVDIGAEHHLTGVEFVTRSMADGTARTATFTVAVDDAEPLGPFAASTVADPHVEGLEATGRRIRFEVADSTGGNVGAVEIRIYGDAG